MSRRLFCQAFFLLAVCGAVSVLRAQTGITYVYDELGRLVGVVNAAGEAAIYAYDAVGNLLSITRKTATQVSVMEFTPNKGPSGTTSRAMSTCAQTGEPDGPTLRGRSCHRCRHRRA